MADLVNLQMGKSKLTDQFIDAIRNAFKTHRIVKISFLPSSTRDKAEMRKMASEICSKLDDEKSRYDFTMIGFRVTIRKFWKH